MPGAIILALMVLFVMDYNLVDGAALHDPGVAAFPIYILFISFIFGRKAIPISTILCIASIFMVYFVHTQGIMEFSNVPTVNRVMILTILLVITAFLISTVNNSMERAMARLEEAYENTLAGWGKVLEYRDADTEGHSQRVTNLSVALAKEMGCPVEEIQLIRRGALLHDIGKMAIPDEILFKAAFLNDDERTIIEKHPIYAKEMLAEIPFLHNVLDIPYSHHERWDGKGYPEGLKGEEIPLAARIFTIADFWDSLCSDRPYRKAWPKEKAMAYIRANSGIIFDPKVVEAFVSLIEKTETSKLSKQPLTTL
jgi:putative nucleotidyltransferase with HDIG domain